MRQLLHTPIEEMTIGKGSPKVLKMYTLSNIKSGPDIMYKENHVIISLNRDVSSVELFPSPSRDAYQMNAEADTNKPDSCSAEIVFPINQIIPMINRLFRTIAIVFSVSPEVWLMINTDEKLIKNPRKAIRQKQYQY
jgi:hypothetical protein